MRGRVAAAAMVLLTSAATLFSQGQGGGFVAYPARRPGDPAAIERGRAAYGVNCVFCHGIDARGGDDGGPNLLRSSLVLEDVKGERIGSVLRAGRLAHTQLGANTTNAPETYTVDGKQYVLVAAGDAVYAFTLY